MALRHFAMKITDFWRCSTFLVTFKFTAPKNTVSLQNLTRAVPWRWLPSFPPAEVTGGILLHCCLAEQTVLPPCSICLFISFYNLLLSQIYPSPCLDSYFLRTRMKYFIINSFKSFLESHEMINIEISDCQYVLSIPLTYTASVSLICLLSVFPHVTDKQVDWNTEKLTQWRWLLSLLTGNVIFLFIYAFFHLFTQSTFLESQIMYQGLCYVLETWTKYYDILGKE